MKAPDTIKEIARNMRKDMTSSEKILWEHLKRKKLGWKQFQKQKPIFVYEESPWFPRYIIPDFVCLDEKLIIEIDGSIHIIPEIIEFDKYKQSLLENRWYRILRFTNEEVLHDMNKVLDKIVASFLWEQRKEYKIGIEMSETTQN